MKLIRYATITLQIALVALFLALGNVATLSPDTGKALVTTFVLLLGLVLFSDYLTTLERSGSGLRASS